MEFKNLPETKEERISAQLVTFNNKLTTIAGYTTTVEVLENEYGEWNTSTVEPVPVTVAAAAFVIKTFGIETLFIFGNADYLDKGNFNYIRGYH